MKWQKWLENWNITGLKINTGFLEMEFSPSEPDKRAAWEMYVELLTRITTQELQLDQGDEQTALDSIYSLFPTTRDIIKQNGRDCAEFTKIAVVVLNQKIRPFTAKWHKVSLQKGFDQPSNYEAFRIDLAKLQEVLIEYSRMLADMAEVEDLTKLENE